MLKRLTIEQFVIIDKLSIEFLPGLTILTGETGAGKSIILDAMLLILGDPSNAEGIRQGADQSVIEAVLTPPASNPVWTFLAENNLGAPDQKEILIRRVIKKFGADDIQLNGKFLEQPLLKKIGAFLGEIHGQNANHSLLEPSNQLSLLDMAGSFTKADYKDVAEALNNVSLYKKQQEEENVFYNANMRSLGEMEAMAKRLEAAGLAEKKIEFIKSEHARLQTARETNESFQEITAHLVSSTGAIRILSAANLALTRQKNLDAEKMKKLAGHLAGALQNVRDAVSETTRLAPEYEIDTKPLHGYKASLAALQQISEETKIPIDNMSLYYEDLTSKINRIRNYRARVAELEDLMRKSEDAYKKHAHALTQRRIAAGQALDKDINAELPRLKLPKAEFQVLVEERANTPWTPVGFNTVTFTARMNPGMPFSPITETASGGELARLVLAIKIVLQAIQKIPTLVFDEVDVGIGGAAAAALGERIAHLADTTQVMAITHSPQVAARGNQHYYVSKKIENGVTTSAIRTLTLDERINEISRMLAGEELTGESRAAAKMLIDEAVTAAGVRQQALKQA